MQFSLGDRLVDGVAIFAVVLLMILAIRTAISVWRALKRPRTPPEASGSIPVQRVGGLG